MIVIGDGKHQNDKITPQEDSKQETPMGILWMFSVSLQLLIFHSEPH